MARNIAGCYTIGSPEAATLIGCGNVGCVVGAEALGQTAGVWVKTRFYRQGPFLCATVYSVAAGEPRIVELKVDLRPLQRAVFQAHAKLHERDNLRGTGPTVGWSLGSLWKGAKKAAQAIGRSKLVKGVVAVSKGVVKVAKTVAKSKIVGSVLGVAAVFPLTAPFAAPALGAYAAANAAVKGVEAGRKVVNVASSAISTLSRSKQLSSAVKTTAARASAAVKTASAQMTPTQRAALSARAAAAGKVTLSAAGKAKLAAAVSRVPPKALPAVAAGVKRTLAAAGAARANAVIARAVPPAAGKLVAQSTALSRVAAPELAAAAALSKKLADPAVRKRMTEIKARGDKSEALLKQVAVKAATAKGPAQLDAQKSAVIVNLVARNNARIQAMSQANAGGLPGMLITPQGKLVRGRFRVQAKASGQGQGGLLYQGKGKPRERGLFATVAGFFALDGHGDHTTLESIAVNGDLPLDGVRLMAAGPNARSIGKYEEVGCGGGCGCAPCQAAAG